MPLLLYSPPEKNRSKLVTEDRLRNKIDAYHPVTGFNAF